LAIYPPRARRAIDRANRKVGRSRQIRGAGAIIDRKIWEHRNVTDLRTIATRDVGRTRAIDHDDIAGVAPNIAVNHSAIVCAVNGRSLSVRVT
jgi:hypothetical protein